MVQVVGGGRAPYLLALDALSVYSRWIFGSWCQCFSLCLAGRAIALPWHLTLSRLSQRRVLFFKVHSITNLTDFQARITNHHLLFHR